MSDIFTTDKGDTQISNKFESVTEYFNNSEIDSTVKIPGRPYTFAFIVDLFRVLLDKQICTYLFWFYYNYIGRIS